jgi:hypothetical protein
MRPELIPAHQSILHHRKEAFLRALAETGSAIKAARASGWDRSNAYKHRRVDPAFDAAWVEACRIAAEDLEDEARRRAIEGVRKPLYWQGQPIYLYRSVIGQDGQPMRDEQGNEIREVLRDEHGQPVQACEHQYSDGLLSLLLKGNIAEKYGDNRKVELSGPGGGPIELAAVSDTEKARRIAFALHKGLVAATQGPAIESEVVGVGDDLDDLL